METQKILKGKHVTVLVDYRERKVAELLRKLGLKVNEVRLDLGDYVCSSRVVVERKEKSDFVSSIIDGRIFRQAKLLRQNFERPIIVVEGYSNREIEENALKAAVATLLTRYNLALVSTKNMADTARLIYWLAKKEQEEGGYELAFKVGKKSRQTKEFQEQIVATLPGVSKVLSHRLLGKFKTVERVFCASETELKKVRGIGEKLAKKIKKILTTTYH